MAQHKIEIQLPQVELSRKGAATISVRKNGRPMGELRISAGGLSWRRHRKHLTYKVRLEDLAALLEERVTPR